MFITRVGIEPQGFSLGQLLMFVWLIWRLQNILKHSAALMVRVGVRTKEALGAKVTQESQEYRHRRISNLHWSMD